MKFMNSYLTVNTLPFHYEDQPLFVVETITNKHNVWANADFLNVSGWYLYLPLCFEGLI
jgi:hypothetical protein